MIKANTGGCCRYCAHHVVKRHVGHWCADCEVVGEQCGATAAMRLRRDDPVFR